MPHAKIAIVGMIALVAGFLLGMQVSGGPTVPMGELRDENRDLHRQLTALKQEREQLQTQLKQAAERNQQSVSSEYGRLMDEGVGHFKAKDYESAIDDFTRALAIAQGSRGMAYQENGEWKNAIGDYEQVLELRPDDVIALASLARILAACPDDELRNGQRAVEYAQRACQLTEWSNVVPLATLAAAYAEIGDFEAAVDLQRKAIDLVPESAKPTVSKPLKLYEQGKPLRLTEAP